MQLQIMPKGRRKRKMTGVLGPEPHPYHRHWEFTYIDAEVDSYQDVLDNTDLELCVQKNQVKIVASSVRLYIGEKANSVHVNLYLPC